jgi:hypothetical protein
MEKVNDLLRITQNSGWKEAIRHIVEKMGHKTHLIKELYKTKSG